jgi:hypothetical protein
LVISKANADGTELALYPRFAELPVTIQMFD